MDKYTLPTSVTIKDTVCEINSDFRNVLTIFKALTDEDLLENERMFCALQLFYKTDDYMVDIETAVTEMLQFLTVCEYNSNEHTYSEKPLYDWEQDYNIIVAPVNRILGKDVRGLPYLHWWTFLSAFMEIGECTFSTYVSIRNKLNKGKKLEKYEEKILKDNRNKIILKRKYDSTTQAIMDDIMGV